MKPRVALLSLAFLLAVGAALRHELVPVVRRDDAPRPLAATPLERRRASTVDVVLPAVPAGVQRLRGGQGVLVVHYWAPWERHSSGQAHALDSLRRVPELERLGVAVVCMDPFPSVARYLARQRLRLPVLLDRGRELRRALPCPSIPYTYVLDRSGRVAVSQPGEVDWWSPATLRVLRGLMDEAPRREDAVS